MARDELLPLTVCLTLGLVTTTCGDLIAREPAFRTCPGFGSSWQFERLL